MSMHGTLPWRRPHVTTSYTTAARLPRDHTGQGRRLHLPWGNRLKG